MSGKFHSAVKQWKDTILGILAVLIAVGSFFSPMVNPGWFVSEGDEAMISRKVHSETGIEFHELMSGKYSKDSAEVYKALKRLNVLFNNLDKELKIQKDKQVFTNQYIDSVETKVNYAIENISIHADLLTEEMDEKEQCNYRYFVTNRNDPWNLFNGPYNCRELNSLELKSGCKVYRLPIGSSTKIRVQ